MGFLQQCPARRGDAYRQLRAPDQGQVKGAEEPFPRRLLEGPGQADHHGQAALGQGGAHGGPSQGGVLRAGSARAHQGHRHPGGVQDFPQPPRRYRLPLMAGGFQKQVTGIISQGDAVQVHQVIVAGPLG